MSLIVLYVNGEKIKKYVCFISDFILRDNNDIQKCGKTGETQ